MGGYSQCCLLTSQAKRIQPMNQISEIVLIIISSFGTAGVVILGLSNWLGKVWAEKLIENQKYLNQSELEFLTRKRDVYTKLGKHLRVFLDSAKCNETVFKEAFLEAYDEAYLWASEEVVENLAVLVESVRLENLELTTQAEKKILYIKCMHSMRVDSGHKNSKERYQVISF
jgi:hypothetical protein